MKTKKWILSALLAVLVCGTAAAQTPMQQSRTAFEEGDYERAAQICELAGDRVTDASEKRFLSTLLTMCQDCIRYRDEGDRLYRSGYFAEALTCYSRLLSLNPQDAYAAGRYRLATAEVETARRTSERALAVTAWTPASFRRFADLYPSDADTPAFLGVASYLSGGTVLPDLLVAGAKVAQEFGKDAEAAALLSEAASQGSADALYRYALISGGTDREVLSGLAWAAGSPDAPVPADPEAARTLYDAIRYRNEDPEAALTVWRNRAALASLKGIDPEEAIRKLLKEGKLESVGGGTAYRLGQAAVELDIPAFEMMDAAALKGSMDALEWLSVHHPSAEERTFIRKAFLSDEREPYFEAWLAYLRGKSMTAEDWALMAAYLRQNEPGRRDDILIALAMSADNGDAFKELKAYSEEGTFSSGAQAVLISRLAGKDDRMSARVLKLIRGMKNITEAPYTKHQSRYLPVL